jgi:signal transduction histidine kinase
VTSSPGVLRNRLDFLRRDEQPAEFVLACSRVLLALAVLAAFAVYPIAPAGSVRIAFTLLVLYAVYAVGLVAATYRRPQTERASPAWILHAIDGGWIGAITLVITEPGSPLAVVLTFILLSAAYSVVFALVGGTFGFLTENDRLSLEAASIVARIADQLRPEIGARNALDGAMRELRMVFDARNVMLVARDQLHGRLYRWGLPAAGGDEIVSDTELQPADELTYLFPSPAEAWYATAREGDATGLFEVHCLDRDTGRVRKRAMNLPAPFLAAQSFRSLLVLTAGGDGKWVNRLLLFDARVGERELRILDTIARQVGPALYSLERLSQLRSRVGAAERARVARDLHDGVIQALIGLEMRVDVWRREARDADLPSASQLEHIQNALRAEVLDLRDLMQRMKTMSVDPKFVLDHLASLASEFQRDTGIVAHFVSEVAELDLSPPVCDEIVRIVQEALVNVRKHSGARNVIVRVGGREGFWKFDIDDDGRGFEFTGRKSQAELDIDRKGPVIIKERVRSIGGELAIESNPGRGARVEVWLRQRTHG